MNSVLIIDTIYDLDQGSYSDASMTGKEIIDFIKENNYEVVPILRVKYTNNPQIDYFVITDVIESYYTQDTPTFSDIILKRSLYVNTHGNGLYISYDTGAIQYIQGE